MVEIFIHILCTHIYTIIIMYVCVCVLDVKLTRCLLAPKSEQHFRFDYFRGIIHIIVYFLSHDIVVNKYMKIKSHFKRPPKRILDLPFTATAFCFFCLTKITVHWDGNNKIFIQCRRSFYIHNAFHIIYGCINVT